MGIDPSFPLLRFFPGARCGDSLGLDILLANIWSMELYRTSKYFFLSVYQIYSTGKTAVQESRTLMVPVKEEEEKKCLYSRSLIPDGLSSIRSLVSSILMQEIHHLCSSECMLTIHVNDSFPNFILVILIFPMYIHDFVQ